jgi:Flp pilus assembly protein CpaB
MIVSGASVLAIGDNTSSTVGANESTLVTLAVDPDSAKRILAANQNGIIQLALLGQGVASAATTGP